MRGENKRVQRLIPEWFYLYTKKLAKEIGASQGAVERFLLYQGLHLSSSIINDFRKGKRDFYKEEDKKEFVLRKFIENGGV